jgi:hypothetical protein
MYTRFWIEVTERVGRGLCPDRDVAFGHATLVRFWADGIFSTEEERGPRRAAETCTVSEDKAAWAPFRHWAKGPATVSKGAFAGRRKCV